MPRQPEHRRPKAVTNPVWKPKPEEDQTQEIGFIEREGNFLRARLDRLQEYNRVTREVDTVLPNENPRGVLQYMQVGAPSATNEKGIIGWIKYNGNHSMQDLPSIADRLARKQRSVNSNKDPRRAETGEVDADQAPLPPRDIFGHKTGTWQLLTDPGVHLSCAQHDQLVVKYLERYTMAVAAVKQREADEMEDRKRQVVRTETDKERDNLEEYTMNRVKHGASCARIVEARDVQARCTAVINHEMEMMRRLHTMIPLLRQTFTENAKELDCAKVVRSCERKLFRDWERVCDIDNVEHGDSDDEVPVTESGAGASSDIIIPPIQTDEERKVFENLFVPEFGEHYGDFSATNGESSF